MFLIMYDIIKARKYFFLWPRRSLPGEQRWIWSGKMRGAVSYDDASQEEKWIFLEY